ncbi:MAG TPA: phosphatase PAP2 family protein, partial [Gammaproteobacteria bacterium]|nr:phosphatase PAP2 family protein [Gammaproteobacteria bacterium]
RASERAAADAESLSADFRRFYTSPSNALYLTLALGAAGAGANTNFDSEVQDRWREDVKSSATDAISDVAVLAGEAGLTIPLLAGARLLGPEGKVTDWAGRSLRAVFVGGPLVLALQQTLGGKRPSEGEPDWELFGGNNAASGHAFMGGAPILTAAMMAENPYARAALYGASALPGLSRINDDKHYASQVVLGWAVAYLSASTVMKGKEEGMAGGLAVAPMGDGGTGVFWAAVF